MAQEITSLQELTRELAAGASMSDTVEAFMDWLYDDLCLEHLVLFLRTDEGLTGAAARHRPAREMPLPPRVDRIVRTLSEQALKSREPVIARDAEGLEGADLQGAGDLEVRSHVSLPLVHRGRVLGVAALTARGRRDFRASLAWLEIVGSCAALALAGWLGEEGARDRGPERPPTVGAPSHPRTADWVSEALLVSEDRFRLITESMCDLFCYTDLQGRYLYITPSYRRILGYAPEDLLGEVIFQRVHPDDLELAASEFQKGILTRIPGQVELRYRHANGRYVWLDVTGSVILGEGGEPLGTVVSSRDITERREAELARRESEEKYRTLVESIQDGVFLIQERILRFANRPFAEMIGWSPHEVVGMDFRRLVAPEDLPMVQDHHHRRLMGEPVPREYEFRMIHRDGETRVAVNLSVGMTQYQGRPAFIGTVKNITEKKQAEEERRRIEEQFRHVQKLESLAVLAGGIAHDFNNLLMGILGSSDLGLVSLPENAPASLHFEAIQKAVVRAAELCRQMLAYSGRAQFFIEQVQPADLIREVIAMARMSLSPQISLSYAPAGDLPPVEGDAAQLRQVITNLIINASESIGECQGKITVSTAAVDCTRAHFRHSYLNDAMPEGLYVCIEVTDTGCGMDEVTRQKVFDPFFSTKFTGRGLGLAAVLGIVRGHKGAIEVHTAPGQGSTFRVFLPAAADTRGVHAADSLAPDRGERGSRTVLLVDDEEPVRLVASQMMELLGFTVLSAHDGVEGVELLRRNRDEIDLVVLDLAMPRMSGEEAFHAMRAIAPDLPVIITSGYSENEVMRHFAGASIAGFIPKPFSFQNLRETLEGVAFEDKNLPAKEG
ncbi:MAG: PAS domain S-box protein [Syntrophobacteraceae bacterium]|nr:PAS domain S-box protein [Syntrophobacteraceae bacterium]